MGRPSKSLLSRDKIARTALTLLDRDGAEGLTMRSLAKQLNVQAPSLYHHIRGQDEIIDLVHALVDSEIDTEVLRDPDWQSALRKFTRSYRAAFLTHPNAVALVTRRRIRVPSVLRLYDELSAMLLKAGLAPSRTMHYIGLIDSIVLGSTVDDLDRGFAEQADDYAEDYPSLATSLNATRRDRVNEETFELALALVLDALAAELATSPECADAHGPAWHRTTPPSPGR
ncbi:TetR/AcrR family transcriptional regulator C-terminal domain-containing protein [Kribbella sp. NPDC050124]|uniref:TetR/AcrR family transcriptional regulator C-terminal domain-containing protein n=1 Tax=Kribbella sp. NPDC050124 TaxID=3364114 RepID=UPI0037A2F61E